jgi:chromosome segregation ATPase
MKNLKKYILLFSTFFILSCSKNDEVTDSLQTQINTLEATIKTLESTINTLTSNLSTTSSSNASLTNELAAAQIALTEAKNLANAATTDIEALQASLLVVNETLTAIDYSETVSLGETGSLVDQSPMQAKKNHLW